MIKLYIRDISTLFDGAWTGFLTQLPPDRREEARHFRRDSDAARCVGTWILLRDAFAGEGVNIDALPLRRNAHGKPFFEDQLEFSISHAGPFAAAAISDDPVGVDIEEARCKLSVARHFFSASETEAANARSGEAQQLYLQRLWVAKEAFVKAIGTGLKTPLNSFSVVLDDTSATLLQDITPLPIQISEFSEGDYRIAVAGIGEAVRCDPVR